MLNTIDPAVEATDEAIRAYLDSIPDKPVRYHDATGHTVNTAAARGLCAWYVLIETPPGDGCVHVGAVRLGLGAGMRGITTRRYVRPPARLACPDGTVGSVDAFTMLLAVNVGMALDDLERERAQAGHG